jgi:hypothetical protein
MTPRFVLGRLVSGGTETDSASTASIITGTRGPPMHIGALDADHDQANFAVVDQ